MTHWNNNNMSQSATWKKTNKMHSHTQGWDNQDTINVTVTHVTRITNKLINKNLPVHLFIHFFNLE